MSETPAHGDRMQMVRVQIPFPVAQWDWQSLRRQMAEDRGLLCWTPVPRTSCERHSLIFRDASAAERGLRSLASADQAIHAARLPTPHEDILEQPIVIVGAPRSGSTLLFELLSHCPEVWTIGGESHSILEWRNHPPGPSGNRLDAQDVDAESAAGLRMAFASIAMDRYGRPYLDHPPQRRPRFLRLLEKTPKNALRIPFLRKVFPGCRFVYLYRDPAPNIASLIEAWDTERYVTVRPDGFAWHFLLPPGWKQMLGEPIPRIAAAQWNAANTYIMNDLSGIERADWLFVRYEELIAEPEAEIRRICQFANCGLDDALLRRTKPPLPLASSTLSPPFKNKWRRRGASVQTVLAATEAVVERVRSLRV